jgi:hypothetical protein
MRILEKIVKTLNEPDINAWDSLENIYEIEMAAMKLDLTFAYKPIPETELWLQVELNAIQGYFNKMLGTHATSPDFEWGTTFNLGEGLCTFVAQRGESIHVEICLYCDGNELMVENQKKEGFKF